MDTKERRRPASQPGRTANRRRPGKSGPEVVYTQPDPFNRKRFLLHLATVAAVVLALVLGVSIFFKVDKEKIEVSGMDNYTAAQIVEASGIADGDNLLTLSEAQISGRIIAELPYVETVRVDIKLPDTVRLEIAEADVVYSAEAADGSWWLLRSDGKIVEKTNAADASLHTKLLGFKLDSPAVGQKAVAKEHEAQQDENGELIPPMILSSEQLETALQICGYLEGNGFIGDMTTLDVTDPAGLELWYADRYQVYLGDTSRLEYKVRCIRATIDQMKDYDRGELDVSFTVMEDQVIYTPFA